jgi:hypothetical protein
MQHVDPIFPVIDAARFEHLLQAHVVLDGALSDNEAIAWPSLLLFHLVLELGQLHCRRPDTDGELQYRQQRRASLDFFQSVLGHLTVWGSLEAVQIAFLVALLFWCSDRVGPAWSVLGLCVSMATSQGLHRSRGGISASAATNTSATSCDNTHLDAECRGTWWSIFALDKVIAFELSRTSLIRDQDCDYTDTVIHPSRRATSGRVGDNSTDAFAKIVSFAKVLGKITRKNLQTCENEETTPTDQGLELIIVEKVRAIGESVLALVQWADAFPDGQRYDIHML